MKNQRRQKGSGGNGQCALIAIPLLFIASVGLASESAEPKSVTPAATEGAELEVLTGSTLPDVSGPMRLRLPPNLCAMELPPALKGLPPDHPIALEEATTPEKLAVIEAYHHTESIRSLKRQYCSPVLPEAEQTKATKPLPQACTLPPDPVALLDPIHPMADPSRADVKEAFAAYMNAKAALEELQRTCRVAAGLSSFEE